MQNIHNANLPSYTTTVLPTGQVVHGGPFLVQGAPVVYTQPQAVAVTPIVHQVPVAPIPHSVTPEAAQAIVGNDMLTNVAARGGVTNAPLNHSSHIGKILVRNGQRPPTGGDYILESDLPLNHRIASQGGFVTMDFVPGRHTISLDAKNHITAWSQE